MANVSVVRELGYLLIFVLLGAFGQKIQGLFRLGEDLDSVHILLKSLVHLFKSSPEHEIHYLNKLSEFLLLFLIMSKCSPAMSKSTHTWGRI